MQGIPQPPITLRLIVPISQCGSLIGKAGSKIMEMRDITGASITPSCDILPNSTEREIIVSGTSQAITDSVSNICLSMLEVIVVHNLFSIIFLYLTDRLLSLVSCKGYFYSIPS